MSYGLALPEANTPESSDYFEKIPCRNYDSSVKRFEVMADAVSGRIPVTGWSHGATSHNCWKRLLQCGRGQ